jgi:hypothetical protein
MQCPNCDYLDSFDIVGTSSFRMFDDGSESHGDIDFDEDSPCYCPQCHHQGVVKDFKQKTGPRQTLGEAIEILKDVQSLDWYPHKGDCVEGSQNCCQPCAVLQAVDDFLEDTPS